MKLAEALALRSASRRRVDELRSRITANATYQEGTEPAEDAAALLTEVDVLLDELESLIRRINRTNAATDLGADGTMTDALARRDVLRMRHSMLVAAAEAAGGGAGPGVYRHMRSELRLLSALPVARLRGRADQVARDVRELDTRIQQANWTVELLD
jgi:uncharacterized protein DUF6847